MIAADFGPVRAYSFMIFNLLCAPCFAAIGAIKREMGSRKWTVGTVAYMCGFAYAVSMIVYQLAGLVTGEATFGLFTIVAVAALVGLVIGWLAEKGYTLLHGKQGKGKVAILIVAILVGVALGTIGADVFALAEMINAGEIPLTYGDIPEFLLYMLQTDSEYVTATLTNLGMGVVFAGLGVYGILKKTGKEVADTAFVDLK